MSKKIQNEFPYYGLGFLVRIVNVPLIEIEGEWVPDVDFNKLAERMALAVPLKPGPLTGNECRFLRRHLGWTLDELAGKMKFSRQGVIKWEKTGDVPTKMETASERTFRLLALDAQGLPTHLFKKAFDLVFAERIDVKAPYEIDPKRDLNRKNYLENLLSAA